MLHTYRAKSQLTKAHIQMHLSVLLWGATAVLGRAIELSEGLLVWYRMLLVAVSLWVFIQIRGTALKVSRQQFALLAGIGTILMVHWLFFYGAVKYSNVSVTLSLFSSTTLFTALMEPLVTGKRFNRLELLYSFMAMLGIGLIFYTDQNTYGIGMVLAILAAFVGAFFNILNKKVVNDLPSSVVSFYEIATGFAVLTLFMPLYLWAFTPAKLLPTAPDSFYLLILAVLCTHAPLILSLNALKYLSAFTLNLTINLEPVYGIALAFAIYHENRELNVWFFVGAAIVMLSVLLHGFFSREKEDVPIS